MSVVSQDPLIQISKFIRVQKIGLLYPSIECTVSGNDKTSNYANLIDRDVVTGEKANLMDSVHKHDSL